MDLYLLSLTLLSLLAETVVRSDVGGEACLAGKLQVAS